jgi:hypothetical protein
MRTRERSFARGLIKNFLRDAFIRSVRRPESRSRLNIFISLRAICDVETNRSVRELQRETLMPYFLRISARVSQYPVVISARARGSIYRVNVNAERFALRAWRRDYGKNPPVSSLLTDRADIRDIHTCRSRRCAILKARNFERIGEAPSKILSSRKTRTSIASYRGRRAIAESTFALSKLNHEL